MLTYTGDHEVKEISSVEKPSNTSIQEQETSSGLENLNFMDDFGLSDQISVAEGASLEPSPSPSDGTEERTETGLTQLKDEFLGQKYSVALLPKKHGDGTQRLVI